MTRVYDSLLTQAGHDWGEHATDAWNHAARALNSLAKLLLTAVIGLCFAVAWVADYVVRYLERDGRHGHGEREGRERAAPVVDQIGT